MALFRRNKTDQTGMPAEVQDYYKAEGRERTGVAWLLALGTLLVTVLLVMGLFFGGRWALRKLKNNDKPAPVAVQTDVSKDKTTTKTTTEPSSSTPAQTSPSSQNPPAVSPPATTPATTPSSKASDANLPSTGPGDTLAVFVATVVIAYMAHRFYLSRAQQ